MSASVYEKFYVNFTTALPRALLEDLAQGLVQANATHRLGRLTDQYIQYCCLEDNLFSLERPHVLKLFNDPSTKEDELKRVVKEIADSLMCLLLSIGGPIPVIVSPRGDSSSNMIASEVETRVKNHLLDFGSLGTGKLELHDQLGLQRPVVFILDRSFDLSTVLRHSSAYNSLVHDVFEIRLNRIPVSKEKVVHVDEEDWFWRENASLAFPQVTEAVDTSLATYKVDQEKVTKRSDLNNTEALNAEELRIALKVIPELTERKRIIDVHLNICSALLEAIKKRDLGDLVGLQRDPQKSILLEAIRTKGEREDKLRLILLYYLRHPEMSKVDLEELEKASGLDSATISACVKFIKQVNPPVMPTSSAPQNIGTGTAPTSPTGLINAQLLQRITDSSNSLMGGMLGNLVSSVKNLIPESTNDSPLCRQVDSLLDVLSNNNNSNSNQIVILDPSKKGTKSAFNHVILFIVGGATYQEYNYLKEHFQRKPRLSFTLGSTELLNAQSLLCQMQQSHQSDNNDDSLL